jgi:TRAP-type mannitol/chloroaromatic compound transport system permease small subunit
MSLASLPLRALNLATQGANILGALLIVGLVAIICADVAGRNLFGAPLPGVPEMISLSIVAIVFLQVPQALRSGRLTRSDGLIMRLHGTRPRLATGLEVAFDLLGLLVVATILYAHWPILMRSITRDEYVGAVGALTIPTWPAKLMILIGAGLLALQFFSRIVLRLTGGAPR